MITIVNSWAQGIIVAVIIATIIEIILPEGNNKKYVKVVLGMYILFSIIYPVINGISKKNISINSIITSTNNEIKRYEKNTISIETNSYIETTYKNSLKENISNNLKEKGYKVLNLNIYIETKDENRYGQINSIVLQIEKNNTNERTNTIEMVNIDISNSSKIFLNEEIPEQQIIELKQYFENAYSIEKERIHINE